MAPLWTLRRPEMSDTIKAGTILIKEGTLLPEVVRFESECSVPGWRLLKDLDRYGLDREIREAGWTFFCLPGEIRTTVFGIDEEKIDRKSTRLNSSHGYISYAVFCLKKKNKTQV